MSNMRFKVKHLVISTSFSIFLRFSIVFHPERCENKHCAEHGVAGATVTLVSGESRNGSVVGDTYGYNFTWTLRDGAQTIEQHQFMEFRYSRVRT